MATLATSTAPALARRYPSLHLGFARQVGEMIFASSLGMAAGHLVGIAQVADPELRALLWLVAMSTPMVAWMSVRHHARRCAAEMVAAMAAPMIGLFPLFWLGAISDSTWISLQHCWMTPAMFALMVYRRREYGW